MRKTALQLQWQTENTGLIDRDGNAVSDFVYDAIEPLYENGKIYAYRVMQGESYMAYQGEKYGLLNGQGKMIKQLDELFPNAVYDEYGLIEVSTKTPVPTAMNTAHYTDWLTIAETLLFLFRTRIYGAYPMELLPRKNHTIIAVIMI